MNSNENEEDRPGSSGDISVSLTSKKADLVPQFGWSVTMTHKFKETWNQNIMPRLRQLPDLLPLFIRYFFYWVVTWFIHRRKPPIDLYMLEGKQIYGVPLGGVGSATIGRGFKGEFCRFQMTPGVYTYDIVHADQFILSVRDQTKGLKLYQKVLNGAGNPGKLSAWDWSFNPSDGAYHGLYPRAWYTYNIPEEKLIVRCKQISPVIPHNYTDSCIPAVAFVWTIENQSADPKTVSITFTFKNGTGSKNDKKGKCSSQSFDISRENLRIKGIALEHDVLGTDTTYGIGCIETRDQVVTHMNQFDLKSGADLWLKLSKTGKLDTESCCHEIIKGEMGCAVNCSALIQPNEKEQMVFSLVWDQPKIQFPGKRQTYTRRYSRYICRDNATDKEMKPTTVAVQNLVGLCLTKYKQWDADIEQWQDPVLNDPKLPSWFKSAIFNELYFVSDGGTIWIDYDTESLPNSVPDSENIRKEYGRFAYLESHEYRMYNTYDVHFYSSFALAMLWPKLQMSLQYDFADTVKLKDDTIRTHLFDGYRCPRKIVDSIPHDVGDPYEDPYTKVNSYVMHDVSSWRDLNLKFVLQVFRDYKFTNDKKYLNDMMSSCSTLMKKCLAWDIDGDGLIENAGSADQTYDTWIMNGTSAYCGGLWLASLVAMIEMIKDSNLSEDEKAIETEEYQNILDKGKKSFHDKLWTGEYYKFDSSDGVKSQTIMSDQLCGHWYLAMSGVDDSKIFPKSNVLRALKTIYEKNVLSFCNGEMGAVNGMTPDGSVDLFTLQSEEVWTGVTYSVSAAMINAGMIQEGFKTGEGIYRTVYEKIGMGFETPEALYHTKKYRAIGYMRALGIWSMLKAWNDYKNVNPDSQ